MTSGAERPGLRKSCRQDGCVGVHEGFNVLFLGSEQISSWYLTRAPGAKRAQTRRDEVQCGRTRQDQDLCGPTRREEEQGGQARRGEETGRDSEQSARAPRMRGETRSADRNDRKRDATRDEVVKRHEATRNEANERRETTTHSEEYL